MTGFNTIGLKLKEMYQMITMGGDAELELVDSLDPFSEGIVFSVRREHTAAAYLRPGRAQGGSERGGQNGRIQWESEGEDSRSERKGRRKGRVGNDRGRHPLGFHSEAAEDATEGSSRRGTRRALPHLLSQALNRLPSPSPVPTGPLASRGRTSPT